MKTELLLFCTSKYVIYKNHLINNDLIDNKYNLFDEVKLLNENNLDNYINNIITNIIDLYGGRGHGYWIWKPYLILQELNKLNDGDILVYLDIHCKLDKLQNKFSDIIKYLINENNKPLIIGSVCNENNINNVLLNDNMYTTTKLKNVIEHYLNYNFTENEMYLPQREAGIIFMKKNNFVTGFFKQYFDIMKNNIDAITDIYNNELDNHETFIENRHDQSVCSLLAKYYHITDLNIYWWDLH